MGESARPLVRIRGRGPALLQLRVVGGVSTVLLGSATWSALAPDAALEAARSAPNGASGTGVAPH